MARLDVNIVTSLVGAGLEREALLLKELFAQNDIYSNLMHYTTLNVPMIRSDVTIFLEVVMPQALALSRENWLVPNCEWWDSKNDRFLGNFTKVLCKTQDCYNIWSRKVGPHKCIYTSFEARDIYRPEVKREIKCLHIAGKSEHKNTEAVCRAWRMTSVDIGLLSSCDLPPLTIVSRAPCFDTQWENPFPFRNVTRHAKVTDEEIIEMMNSHLIHIAPSMYEGFGHTIHEGLGCGALVMTTDAPPMNTFEGIYRPWLIPPSGVTKRGLADMRPINPQYIKQKLTESLYWLYNKQGEIQAVSEEARKQFLLNREFFRKTMLGLLDGLHKR